MVMPIEFKDLQLACFVAICRQCLCRHKWAIGPAGWTHAQCAFPHASRSLEGSSRESQEQPNPTEFLVYRRFLG